MALTKASDGLAGAPAQRAGRFRLSSITSASRYYWVRLLLENPAGLVSLCFVAFLIVLAVAAPVISNHEPKFVDPGIRLQGPSLEHYFGTDDLGRDVFSRVIYGTRISLLVGVTVMVGAIVIGSMIGLVAGYYSKLDTWLMRVMDGLEAFPSILLAIAIMATLGPAVKNVIVALAVVYTPNIARLVRSTTLM
ncbi:MAG: ABC transporter permease, partial [Thermomicrobiales bacterium]